MAQSLPVLVWFRSDLRLEDNPALAAAVERASPVIPVFIWSPEEENPWPPGAASRWWLHQSLDHLTERLAQAGSCLVIRKGPTQQALKELLSETKAVAVYWNRRYEPAIIARDAEIKKSIAAAGLDAQSFNSALLFEPWTIRNASQQPFQVFSSFWKTCMKQGPPHKPQSAPRRPSAPSSWPKSLALDELALEPRIDWAGGLRAKWVPGEKGANHELKKFLSGTFEKYERERDTPDHESTSRLSPHLHFGEISPRRVWHSLSALRKKSNAEAVDAYLRQLGWREFAHHLLFHFSHTTNEPLRKEFTRFPWQEDRELLHTWQRGRTGYPFVDAGMRELWKTGWMHNRLRLVVASFLTKHLRIWWEEGAYWFWDTLVDADLANNTLGWQWTSGCGADAAPYFRIFNPTLQGEKFDPEGNYIRQWVPELKRLPVPWIHKPWLAPEPVLVKANVRLGVDYPLPIVDHEDARRKALLAFEQIKK